MWIYIQILAFPTSAVYIYIYIYITRGKNRPFVETGKGTSHTEVSLQNVTRHMDRKSQAVI